MSVFETLYQINCNEHTEPKNGLTYLSWTWAWAEFSKRYPDATYEIKKYDGLPYVYDPKTGYMVYTEVTVEGVTKEMWLPVMDGANRAMKAEPYEVTNKWGKVTKVEAATMFDINKTLMRCLTKNLAMFGLGLYIYAGEDLPEGEEEAEHPKQDTLPADYWKMTIDGKTFDMTALTDDKLKALENKLDSYRTLTQQEKAIARVKIEKLKGLRRI